MGTNKRLREEIKELKDIVNALMKGWKSKHPEDFKMPDGYKLVMISATKTGATSNGNK